MKISALLYARVAILPNLSALTNNQPSTEAIKGGDLVNLYRDGIYWLKKLPQEDGSLGLTAFKVPDLISFRYYTQQFQEIKHLKQLSAYNQNYIEKVDYFDKPSEVLIWDGSIRTTYPSGGSKIALFNGLNSGHPYYDFSRVMRFLSAMGYKQNEVFPITYGHSKKEYDPIDSTQPIPIIRENLKDLFYQWKKAFRLEAFYNHGFSFGGLTAHLTALDHPDVVRGVYGYSSVVNGVNPTFLPSGLEAAVGQLFAGDTGRELIEMGSNPLVRIQRNKEAQSLLEKGIKYVLFINTDDRLSGEFANIDAVADSLRQVNAQFREQLGTETVYSMGNFIRYVEDEPTNSLLSLLDLNKQQEAEQSATLNGEVVDAHFLPLYNFKLLSLLIGLHPLKHNDQVAKPQPKRHKLQQTLIGTTTEQEIESKLNILKKISLTRDKNLYLIKSHLPQRPTKIVTTKGRVESEHLVIPEEVKYHINEILRAWDYPDYIHRQSFFYGNNYTWVVYYRLGLAVLVNRKSQLLVEAQSISPTFPLIYRLEYGEDLVQS